LKGPEIVYPWMHKRRFNAYPEYLNRIFGEKVRKLPVDAGFSCPNRDGTIGTGGCTFCNNKAFSPSYGTLRVNLAEQVQQSIHFQKARGVKATSWLVYLQSYSNTYMKIAELKRIYLQALSQPGVKGLVIATRPDCIDEDKLDLLQGLSKKYYIEVEYGIESCNDEVLKAVKRGHTYAQSVEAIEGTAAMGIKTGAHLIVGLPGDNPDYFPETASLISKLPLTTLKVHQLQIIRDTPLETSYHQNPDSTELLTLANYIETLIDFVERLHPSIVLERIAAEVPPRFLAVKVWNNTHYDEVIRLFEKRLEERDTWQGKLYQS
jgi:uncharacterized protein